MSNLFTTVVEVIESLVKNPDDRREAYSILIEAFIDEGYRDIYLNEAVEMDPILDEVLEEYIDERNLLDEGFDDLDD
jgi:hypothetical protein